TAGDQTEPAIAALPNGTFVIVWQSDDGIHGQRFKANGAANGTEFLVNATVADAQSLPSVSGTPDNGFVVAWQLGATPDIVAQRYRPNGAKLGTEFVVNTTMARAQTQPAISAFDDGGFVMMWTAQGQDGSGLGVYGRIYLADGAPNG